MKVIIPLREIGYEPRKFEIKIPHEEIDYSGEYEVLGEYEISLTVQKTDFGHKVRVEGKVPMSSYAPAVWIGLIGTFTFPMRTS